MSYTIYTHIDALAPIPGKTEIDLLAALKIAPRASQAPPDGGGILWMKTSDSTLRFTTALGEIVLGDGGGVWGSITGTIGDQTDLASALSAKAPLASPTFTGTLTADTISATAITLGGNAVATQSYVSSAISALVASSPSTLDTLNELAAALGNDANFATTTATALGVRLAVNGSQSFTTEQRLQGRDNLGIGAADYVTFGGVLTEWVKLVKTSGGGCITLRTLESGASVTPLNFALGGVERTLTITANASLGGTNTGDQTITLTGDVTGSGTGSFAATIANNAVTSAKINTSAVVTAKIADAAVTLAKMDNLATARFLGRATSGTGAPEALTGTQATALLDTFTASAKGLVPAASGGSTTTEFLRKDGTWQVPSGGAGITMWTATAQLTRDQSDTYIGATGPLFTATVTSVPNDGDFLTVDVVGHASITLEFDNDASVSGANYLVDLAGISTVDDVAAAIVTTLNSVFSANVTATNLGSGSFTILGMWSGGAESLNIAGIFTGAPNGSDSSGSYPADGTLFAVVKAAETGKKHYILRVSATEDNGYGWNNGFEVGYGPNAGGFTSALEATALTPNQFVSMHQGEVATLNDTGEEALGNPTANTAISINRKAASGGESVDGGTSQTITVRVTGFTV